MTTAAATNFAYNAKKEEMFAEWFQVYSAFFVLSKAFGGKIDLDSHSKMITEITLKQAEALGFTNFADELVEWIEKQPRETALGTIPVPNFDAD